MHRKAELDPAADLIKEILYRSFLRPSFPKGGRSISVGVRCADRRERDTVMKIIRKGILWALERHTPRWVTVLEIRILNNTTARAFGVPEKKIRSWSVPEALREYTAFTRSCLRRRRPDPGRLYREAYRTGERVRRLTGFTEKNELERLTFYLYRNIRILMEGSLPGEVTVSECWFSRFYTPEQCVIMSNVDSGMVAGILGGGSLEFSERLTEGCGRCRACFQR